MNSSSASVVVTTTMDTLEPNSTGSNVGVKENSGVGAEEVQHFGDNATTSAILEIVDMKNNDEQKEWMKRIFLNYKPNASSGEIENLWNRVTEMVGFFSEPVPTGGGTGDTRRVVCYPDLPIPAAAAPQNHHEDPVFRSSAKGDEVYHRMPTSMQPVQRTVSVIGAGGAGAPLIAAAKQEPRDDPYQCNVCSKTFAVPARLTRHYRTHTGERPFQCDFCDKKFGVKENLSVHRRIHTKERPYKCEVCSRAFEHSGKLHRHMRIHTGERPHACSVCDKTFIQSGQLVIHMRTHTGEKPYVCPVCHKGFTCSKQLKVHSRTHTGEKPYNCDICGKSFGYNHVLKLHQVAHYGQKVYKCTICQGTFTSKKTMEAHIKTHSENGSQSPPASPGGSGGVVVPLVVAENNSESSCASDKENKDLMPSPSPVDNQEHFLNPYQYYTAIQSPSPQIASPQYPPEWFYLQSTSSPGVNPALLAAAAAAREERTHSPPQASTSPYMEYPHTTDMRNFITVYMPPSSDDGSVTTTPPRLDRANDIRKRVEAALAIPSEEDASTPCVSSRSPSTSPEPTLDSDASNGDRHLPPRKRTKAILKSMQESPPPVFVDTPLVRYCSVIQFGGSAV